MSTWCKIYTHISILRTMTSTALYIPMLCNNQTPYVGREKEAKVKTFPTVSLHMRSRKRGNRVSKLKRLQEAHRQFNTTTTNIFDDLEEGDKDEVLIYMTDKQRDGNQLECFVQLLELRQLSEV